MTEVWHPSHTESRIYKAYQRVQIPKYAGPRDSSALEQRECNNLFRPSS